jgi:hypothetical protein
VTAALSPCTPEPADSPDRRSGLRALSILRVGRVVWDDLDQLCVVRNISPGGIMLECLHAPAVNQTVLVELRSDKRMTGQVRWASEGKVGIQFDREINVEQMLREDRSPLLRVRPRAPRFVRRGEMRLIVDGETVPARVTDISIVGVSCRPELPVKAGEPIVAALDGVGATNAEVRWVRGDLTGVRFEKPLPWKAFMHWLDRTPRG